MATTSGVGLSGCGPVAGGLKLEANKMAEIDVRARASAIRSAKARVEFFSFFFILFGGLEVPGSNGECTRTASGDSGTCGVVGGRL